MSISIPSLRLALLGLALAFVGQVSVQAQDQPRKGPAIKHAEKILGKPLTETQKKAIRAANGKRQKAIKPIQDKYRVEAAKALGLTVAQYTEREKKLRPGQGKGH
ncbi:hypothetical protein EON80_26555 [bacterium]|nr:MAG: hypothetical protein EON80_26555 [bacterium]